MSGVLRTADEIAYFLCKFFHLLAAGRDCNALSAGRSSSHTGVRQGQRRPGARIIACQSTQSSRRQSSSGAETSRQQTIVIYFNIRHSRHSTLTSFGQHESVKYKLTNFDLYLLCPRPRGGSIINDNDKKTTDTLILKS